MARKPTPTPQTPRNSPHPPPFIGTESEIRIARYRHIEREADAMGRVIGVRRLKPSEQGRLYGMTSDLMGHDEAIHPTTGEKMDVPHRAPLFVAAAVCEIDGLYIPFPRNRGELDAVWDRLDSEGMEAAIKALGRLNPPTPSPEEGEEGPEPLAEAKNL